MTDLTANAPRPRAWGVLILMLALTLGIGFAGSLATMPQIPTWYAGLNKPWFTPPNALFGPVWTTLYVMIAVAGWRLWTVPAAPSQRRAALIAFFVQLALNAAWSPVFFGLNAPAAGLAIIVALVAALLVTIALSWRVDRFAALLLVPYLAWVSFATALNGAIVVLN